MALELGRTYGAEPRAFLPIRDGAASCKGGDTASRRIR